MARIPFPDPRFRTQAAYLKQKGLDPSEEDKSLFKGKKTVVLLDDFLKENIYGKRNNPPDSEELMVLQERFCQSLSQWYSIKHPESEPIIGKGTLKPIRLISERRQGNKTVTRCLHLEDYGFELQAIQSALMKKFASSVTIPPPLGGGRNSKPQYELLAQGPMIKQWGEYLTETLNIPKQFVEVCDKAKRGK